MATVQVATLAMATRFELVLHGPNSTTLRAAGEEALAEIQRLDATLSAYRPESEVSALNRSAGTHPVRVSPEVFRLIQHAQILSQATQGAFDITVGPLLQTWGFLRGTHPFPTPDQVTEARASVGSHILECDANAFTIRFAHPKTRIDLGSIGKGYALDRAELILREAGVAHALLHGGTSTTIAIGQPADADTWKIAIAHPDAQIQTPAAIVELHDESLSVSAVSGKGFTHEGQFYGHVIDPRSGYPVSGAQLAAVVLPSATESDALSTALLIRPHEMLESLRQAHAPIRCLVALTSDAPDSVAWAHHQLPPLSAPPGPSGSL